MVGTLKMFNRVRNFGFVVASDGTDHWFHGSSASQPELIPAGAAVEFLLDDYDPPRAVAVKRCADDVKRMAGTVNGFDRTRFFGFVTIDGESDRRIFFHGSSVVDVDPAGLLIGSRVSFELTEDRQGRWSAMAVKRA